MRGNQDVVLVNEGQQYPKLIWEGVEGSKRGCPPAKPALSASMSTIHPLLVSTNRT